MVKYRIEGTNLRATEVVFSPIEFLDWGCLTIGALGWGQIQIANSNVITVNDGYSRKDWMLQLCNTMLDFYPAEILKIQDRSNHFLNLRYQWESREDTWAT